MESIGNENKIRRLGFCLSLHIEAYDDIDAIIKTMVASMFSLSSVFWKPGNFWREEQLEDKEKFTVSFDREISVFDNYYEGIQTRNIGSLIINHSNSFIENSKSSQYIISFRKIHDGYEIMLFAFGETLSIGLVNCVDLYNSLESEIMQISEVLFESAPIKFRSNLVGPTTVFYIINKLDKNTSLEEELTNPTSDYSTFLQKVFCSKGVEYKKLPRSYIDNKLILIRHPSYHFYREMSEKYLLLPISTEIDIPSLMRTVDIFSSIEYYFTRFFLFIRIAYDKLHEIEKKTQSIFPFLEKVLLSKPPYKEASALLDEINTRSNYLFVTYSKVDKIQEEADHMYSDAMYLISGVVTPSSYSQLNEKRLSQTIEGVAESIGQEMQMRSYHTKNSISRAVGRSYTTISSVSNLTRANYELFLNKTMVNYTKEIKHLTILIAVLTIVIVFFTIMAGDVLF